MKIILLIAIVFSTSLFANDNTCTYANDGSCDDGGAGSSYSLCDLGTDVNDCGRRGNGGTNPSGDLRGRLKQCKTDLSNLQASYNEDYSRWELERERLMNRIRRLQSQNEQRDEEEKLQCVGANMHGKYAQGGGCNMHGCFYPSGGCNMHGCFYSGGSCNMHGCIKEAPKSRKACND